MPKRYPVSCHVLHRRYYRLSLQFVTTGAVSRTHQEEAAQRVEQWDKASFEVFGRRDLTRVMQDYIGGVSPPVPTIPLGIHGEQLFHRFDKSTGISSWVFTMLGEDLGRLYNEVGDRIFARNIRGYQGKTEVNKSIKATLHDEPDAFWYYNNGVTIICDEAKQITEERSKKLRVKDAQIINGQQTTRILAEHGKSPSTVLVKVIVVPRVSETAQARYSHLVDQIVIATNWQNFISQSDLKSNDVEQVRLERELRKIGYQYLGKKQTKSEARRTAGKRGLFVLKKEDLARFVGAALLDPYYVRLGKDRLFEDDFYPIIFNGRNPTDYLTFYWLGRTVSYFSRGDIRRGYARWLVLNFLWDRIGDSLEHHGMREAFRYISERDYRYERQLTPLYRAIRCVYNVAMSFYRNNKKTKDGILDESTFFKHDDLHRKFAKFWRSSKNSKRAEVERNLRRFIRLLRRIEGSLVEEWRSTRSQGHTRNLLVVYAECLSRREQATTRSKHPIDSSLHDGSGC